MNTSHDPHGTEGRSPLDAFEKHDPEISDLFGPPLTDEELDAFIARNREALEESILRGREDLKAGKCRIITPGNTEAFIEEIIEEGNRRRAAQR